MKLHEQSTKTGFTLLEVMLASVLGAIVMLSCSTLIVGFWRAHHRFLNQEITMNEIKILAITFQNEVRSKTSLTDTVLNDYASFSDTNGATSSYTYNASAESITYLSSDQTSTELLPSSVVSGFQVIPTPSTKMIEMIITVKETELNKTNKYHIAATTR